MSLWNSPSRWVDADMEKREVLKNSLVVLWFAVFMVVLAAGSVLLR